MAHNEFFEFIFPGFDDVTASHDKAADKIVVTLRIDPEELNRMKVRNELDVLLALKPAPAPIRFSTGRHADRAPMRRRLALAEQLRHQRRDR